jgi:hypothetical protein
VRLTLVLQLDYIKDLSLMYRRKVQVFYCWWMGVCLGGGLFVLLIRIDGGFL